LSSSSAIADPSKYGIGGHDAKAISTLVLPDQGAISGDSTILPMAPQERTDFSKRGIALKNRGVKAMNARTLWKIIKIKVRV
jgi:hypothetical protein